MGVSKHLEKSDIVILDTLIVAIGNVFASNT